MTDQIYYDNYLLLLKSTVEVYVHGTLESVNKNIRNTLQDHLMKTLECQNKAYEEMTKEGWYTIENVKAKEIEKTINKINKEN